MSIILNDLVKKQDIVDRFNTRVRNLVTANTNWGYGTGVWNTNVGTVIANSTAYGGGLNRGTYSDPTAPALSATHLVPIVGAQTSVVGHVTNVLRSFMSVYANSHRVALNNTGNLAPASYNGTVRLDGAPGADVSAIQSDFNASAASFNVLNGKVITATNLNNLIEACRTIWINRAYNPVLENYYYSYCHSSCHSSAPPCHGSRGRR